jgi:hypothetical protein
MQSESTKFRRRYYFNALNSLRVPTVLVMFWCKHERGKFLFQLDLTIMRSLQEIKVVSVIDIGRTKTLVLKDFQ